MTVLCCLTIGNALADWEHIPGQLTIEILQAPTPMVAENKYYLVYELHLTNYHRAEATLTSLEIFTSKAADTQLPVYQFLDNDLAKLMHPIGKVINHKAAITKTNRNAKTNTSANSHTNPNINANTNSKGQNNNINPNNPLVLPPGSSSMVFLWLALDNEKNLPSQLQHKITFNTSHENKMLTLVSLTTSLSIKKTLPIVVSPPVKGENWVAEGGPSNTSYHRTANLVVNAQDYFAQRYAIDFIKLGKDGISYSGDSAKNENYYCYNKDIFAVAAGTVVAVKDGVPENIPQSGKLALPLDMDTAGGNYVVIDMGNKNYAFYAHLIPHTLKVKLGDQVIKGQLLGKIGNSGNSSEPHLHFHVVDRPSFLGGNGIPYAFDKFAIRPSKVLNNDPIKVEFVNDSWQPVTNALVLENTIMKFDENSSSQPR